MPTHESYTRLLGLALRGGNLVMGSDAVQGAAYAGNARLLLLSADASVRTCKDAQQWAERGNCLLVALPCDKDELGAALGRASVAVAALTDTGLAAAVGERLAQFDAERYGAMAERLRLKSKRAAERARARPDAAKSNRETRPDADKANREPVRTLAKATGKPVRILLKATGKRVRAKPPRAKGKPIRTKPPHENGKPVRAERPRPNAAGRRNGQAAATRRPRRNGNAVLTNPARRGKRPLRPTGNAVLTAPPRPNAAQRPRPTGNAAATRNKPAVRTAPPRADAPPLHGNPDAPKRVPIANLTEYSEVF